MAERKIIGDPATGGGSRRRLPVGLHWWVLAAAAVVFLIALFASRVAGA